MRAGLIIVAAAALSSCSPPAATTIRDVEAFGFTDVHLTGYQLLGCGKDDVWHEGFTARNAGGRSVTGVVCSAPLKGATVRLTA